MEYRVGDNAPQVVFEAYADLSGAVVFARYDRPDGTTTESVCSTVVEDVVRNGYTFRVTRITHTWLDTDLTVPGAGTLRLRWASPDETVRGTLPPAGGWRVLVLPA